MFPLESSMPAIIAAVRPKFRDDFEGEIQPLQDREHSIDERPDAVLFVEAQDDADEMTTGVTARSPSLRAFTGSAFKPRPVLALSRFLGRPASTSRRELQARILAHQSVRLLTIWIF